MQDRYYEEHVRPDSPSCDTMLLRFLVEYFEDYKKAIIFLATGRLFIGVICFFAIWRSGALTQSFTSVIAWSALFYAFAMAVGMEMVAALRHARATLHDHGYNSH